MDITVSVVTVELSGFFRLLEPLMAVGQFAETLRG